MLAGRLRRPAVPPYLWVVGGCLALVAVAVIVVLNSPGNPPLAERSTSTEGGPSTAGKETPKPPAVDKPAEPAPQSTAPNKTVPAKTEPAKVEPQAVPKPSGDLAKALHSGKIEPAPVPIGPKPIATVPSPSPRPVTPHPPARKKPREPAPVGPAVPAAGKRPVPAAAAQAASEKKVREVFDKDIAAAKTPQEKILLSEKLYKAAADSADDPSGQFVLFSQACETAIAAGEVPQAMVAVDEISKLYDFIPLDMKLRLLAKAASEGRTGASSEPTFQLVACTALVLMDDAIAAEDFAAAAKLAKIAVNVSRKITKNAVVKRVTTERSRELDRLQERFKAAEEALDTLAKTPADPEANLTVGRWRCFTRGQWREGLPGLAKGSNPQLAALAKQDLAGAAQPEAAVALAEAWMKQADAEQDSAKPMSRARAAYWYREAIPSLSGLSKAAAEKRLADIAAAGAGAPGRPRGEVQPGNVALADNGATVSAVGGGATGKELIDGNLNAWGLTSNTANAICPCEWTIELDKVYRLQEIRLLLYKGNPQNAYQYVIVVSADGQTFMPLVDRSHGLWNGWQRHQFPAQPVKAIRLIGLKASGNRFAAVELEAYCEAPDTLPEEPTPVPQPADNPAPRQPHRPHR